MIKKYILLGFLSILFFHACDESSVGPIVEPTTGPSLTAPASGSGFTLNEDEVDNSLTTFEWTAADYGYQAAITYTLSIDAAGNNFADAVTIGSSTSLSFSNLSVGKINNILLAKGLPFGFDNQLEIRVCAKVSDLVEVLCSDPIAVTINPFQAEVVYPFLTVPGDYQGWDPANEAYKVFSRKSDDIYEGYIYFEMDGAVYKYAQGLSWDVNWGDIDPADGILDPAGIDNNIPITEGPGLYLLHCDLNTLMHFNQLTNWGVLGSATPTGNDADTDLTWDGEKLTVTLDLTTGSIRFRANDAEDINFGDNFTNGTLEAGGDEIPISEAGNYTIDMYLNVSDYYYELKKN